MKETGMNEDCGHESWGGLMRLLDEHWPDDIFPTKYADDPKRDAGPRIVALTRLVDKLLAERDTLAAQVRAVEAVRDFIDACAVGIAPTHARVYLDLSRRLTNALGAPTTRKGMR